MDKICYLCDGAQNVLPRSSYLDWSLFIWCLVKGIYRRSWWRAWWGLSATKDDYNENKEWQWKQKLTTFSFSFPSVISHIISNLALTPMRETCLTLAVQLLHYWKMLQEPDTHFCSCSLGLFCNQKICSNINIQLQGSQHLQIEQVVMKLNKKPYPNLNVNNESIEDTVVIF